MKRSAILLIFRLLFVFISFNLAVAEKTPEVLETSETFLWKIEKENIPVSYLLGTMHIGKVDSTLPQHIVAAFNKSELLVTEVVLDDHAAQTLTSMILKVSASLSDQFTLEKINKIKRLLEKEIPPTIIDKLNPWAVMMLLSYSVPEGYSSESGVDMLLIEEAKKQNKINLGLEEMIDQIELFTKLTDHQISSFIHLQLEHADELKKESKIVAKFYEENRVNTLLSVITDRVMWDKYFPKEDREFWYNWADQKIIIDRNHAWMAPLEAHLLSRSAFVAVGAAHLFGDEGLLNLLKNRGYTVSPVMPFD